MKSRCISIVKPEEKAINEDSVIAKPSCIAVADGAGGGGVFAERWSKYLLEQLPETPITSFEQLDNWVDGIWEPFYNDCEHLANVMGGGLLLSKFYDEGSFSTLVALWEHEGKITWCSYGDSVAFHYNRKSKELQYSIKSLAEFDNPPYLISCKDPLNIEGFSCGGFDRTEDSIYFVASDALAHYILMMYMASHLNDNAGALAAAIYEHSKNSAYVRTAMLLRKVDFDIVLSKLLNCIGHRRNMERHLEKLRRHHLLAIDDYSMAIMNM